MRTALTAGLLAAAITPGGGLPAHATAAGVPTPAAVRVQGGRVGSTAIGARYLVLSAGRPTCVDSTRVTPHCTIQ